MGVCIRTVSLESQRAPSIGITDPERLEDRDKFVVYMQMQEKPD